MALGTRKAEQQERLWIVVDEIKAGTAAHPFYGKLNAILDEAKFDEFAEEACKCFYASKMGRPGLAPGVYFRCLFVGYFEGLGSERGIAWRVADSVSLRRFLGTGLADSTPDHSTISRTRRLIDLETHQHVFGWVLRLIAERGLLKAETVGVDATMLEANAAMKSIVKKDTGQTYDQFLTEMAKASGIETPTREQLSQMDRKRKKTTSNKEWTSPVDPDAKVTKMKDGGTHLAHKVEHAVDMDTGAIVAITVQGADQGDTKTMVETVATAGEMIAATAEAVNNVESGELVNPEGPVELVNDKGYHSSEVLMELGEAGVRSYIPEPNRGKRNWEDKQAEQKAVYGNRRRVRGTKGKRLLKRRGEYVERSFAHMYETGGMRRTHIRGRDNVTKRLLIQAAGFNLGLAMRQELPMGTPRGLQGRKRLVTARFVSVFGIVYRILSVHVGFEALFAEKSTLYHRAWPRAAEFGLARNGTFTTGC